MKTFPIIIRFISIIKMSMFLNLILILFLLLLLLLFLQLLNHLPNLFFIIQLQRLIKTTSLQFLKTPKPQKWTLLLYNFVPNTPRNNKTKFTPLIPNLRFSMENLILPFQKRYPISEIRVNLVIPKIVIYIRIKQVSHLYNKYTIYTNYRVHSHHFIYFFIVVPRIIQLDDP